MAEAVVDSNVLFGFRMKRDQWHERATPIVRGIDAGELPRGRITNYALPEVLVPIQKRAGHDRAVETLDFLRDSRGFGIETLSEADLVRGQAIFRRETNVKLPDAITVAYMRRVGIEYVYSFDDDFDRFDEVTRLNTAIDPYADGD